MNSLLRGDSKATAEFYTNGRQWGCLNADDVRELVDLPPRGVTDDFLTAQTWSALRFPVQHRETRGQGWLRRSKGYCPMARNGRPCPLCGRRRGTPEVFEPARKERCLCRSLVLKMQERDPDRYGELGATRQEIGLQSSPKQLVSLPVRPAAKGRHARRCWQAER